MPKPSKRLSTKTSPLHFDHRKSPSVNTENGQPTKTSVNTERRSKEPEPLDEYSPGDDFDQNDIELETDPEDLERDLFGLC